MLTFACQFTEFGGWVFQDAGRLMRNPAITSEWIAARNV